MITEDRTVLKDFGATTDVLRYKVSLSNEPPPSNEPPIFGYPTETHHFHEAISPPFLTDFSHILNHHNGSCDRANTFTPKRIQSAQYCCQI